MFANYKETSALSTRCRCLSFLNTEPYSVSWHSGKLLGDPWIGSGSCDKHSRGFSGWFVWVKPRWFVLVPVGRTRHSHIWKLMIGVYNHRNETPRYFLVPWNHCQFRWARICRDKLWNRFEHIKFFPTQQTSLFVDVEGEWLQGGPRTTWSYGAPINGLINKWIAGITTLLLGVITPVISIRSSDCRPPPKKHNHVDLCWSCWWKKVRRC